MNRCRSLSLAMVISATCSTFFSASTGAVCEQPKPRVCAEFFHSDVVFVGTVIRERTVPQGVEFFDAWRYTLRVRTVYRGKAGPFLTVFTDNNSVRYPLKVGESYLLFAYIDKGRLTISGCGNNKEVASAQQAIREIHEVLKRIKSAHGGEISGEVRLSHSNGDHEAAGIVVTARHGGKSYSAVTDRNGEFHMSVPPGAYIVRVRDKNHKFEPFDFSYDDPSWVIVHNGGCAQVLFIE